MALSAPVGMKLLFQTAGRHWAFMITERAMVSNAIQGVLIAMAFAFVVLLFSTHNILISLYSILSISGIVASVMAVMQL